MTIENAHNRATAAIDALAREAERLANEHAFALDRLRAEVESLRTINAGLRERLADLEHRWYPDAPAVQPVDTEAPREPPIPLDIWVTNDDGVLP